MSGLLKRLWESFWGLLGSLEKLFGFPWGLLGSAVNLLAWASCESDLGGLVDLLG